MKLDMLSNYVQSTLDMDANLQYLTNGNGYGTVTSNVNAGGLYSAESISANANDFYGSFGTTTNGVAAVSVSASANGTQQTTATNSDDQLSSSSSLSSPSSTSSHSPKKSKTINAGFNNNNNNNSYGTTNNGIQSTGSSQSLLNSRPIIEQQSMGLNENCPIKADEHGYNNNSTINCQELKVRNNNNNNSSSNNNTNTLMNNQLEYTNCGEYLAYGAGNANGPSGSPTNMLTKQQQQQQQAYYQQQNQINHAHMYNTQSPVNEHLHGANGMTGMVNFNQTNLPVAGVQHPQQQLIQQQQQHHHIQHNQAPNMSYFNAPGQYPPSSYTSSNSFDFIPLQNVAPVTAYPIHATLTGQPLPGQMSSSITPPPSNNNTPTPLYHHHHHHHLHNLQPQKPLQESKKITAPCSFASRHNQITKKEIENYEDFTDSTNKMDGEEEDEDEEEDDEDEDDEEETDEDDEDDMDDEETSADEARYINPHYNPNSMRASKRKFNQAAAAAAAAGTANVSYVSSNEYDENDYEIKHNCLISNDDGLNGAGNPATGVGYMTSLFNSPSSLSSSSNQHPNKTANDNGTSKNGTKSDRNKSSRHSRQSKTQQQSSESQIVTKVEASDDAEQSNSNSHQQKDADQYQYQQQQQQQQAALMQTNPHMAGMINTYNLAGIMNDFDLVNLPLRELNKRLRFLPKQMAYNLKKRRRTLKNRKYAQNCRSKRLEQKSEMEIQNSHLKVEINRLQKHIEKLQNENILLKSYLSSSSSSSSNGSVLVTNDMISHTLENNNNNKLQAGLASTTISNKPSPKSLSTSTTASTTTSPTNRLTHIMSSTLK